MWQELRAELHPLGLEIVTVGIDTAGIEACRPFIEAANPSHPSLIDTHHAVAELFGVVNIPNGVWIDEDGMIVRPAETAPAPKLSERPGAGPDALPQHMVDIFTEASRIQTDADAYGAALRDWVVIRGGLVPGDSVVVTGAFVLKAESRKGELGEGH